MSPIWWVILTTPHPPQTAHIACANPSLYLMNLGAFTTIGLLTMFLLINRWVKADMLKDMPRNGRYQ